MNVIKVLVEGIIVLVVSDYAPRFVLDDGQKDNFYDA